MSEATERFESQEATPVVSQADNAQHQQELMKSKLLPFICELVKEQSQKGQFSLEITRQSVGSNEELLTLLKDPFIFNLVQQNLAEQELKVTKVKDKDDPDSCVVLVSWGESEEEEPYEEEERYDAEQEEEAATVAPAPRGRGRGRGLRGRTSQGRGTASSASGTAGRPRPRPVPQQLRTRLEGGAGTLRQVFEKIPIQQLAMDNWVRKRLVLVGNGQPLEKALSRLNAHNILSLPVVDEQSKAVLGLLDVLDVMAVVSEVFSNRARPADARWDLVLAPIQTVLDREHKRKTYLISTQASMWDGIKFLAEEELQRMMIVDRPIAEDGLPVQEQKANEDMVVGLLTQSDVVRFLAQNVMWMKREPLFQKTLKQLDIGTRQPGQILQTLPAWQGFIEIHKQGREGLAMVDNNGALVANLSASNIKGITRRNFQLILRPLDEFLMRDRRRGWWSLPVCVTENDTLERVVLQFVATKIHRMYVVDEQNKPVGEVSLADIMQQLLKLTP